MGRAIVPCGEQCCVRWWPREGKAGPSFPCQDIGFCGGSPNRICGSMEGGDCDAPISRHMAMAAYRPGEAGLPPARGLHQPLGPLGIQNYLWTGEE